MGNYEIKLLEASATVTALENLVPALKVVFEVLPTFVGKTINIRLEKALNVALDAAGLGEKAYLHFNHKNFLAGVEIKTDRKAHSVFMSKNIVGYPHYYSIIIDFSLENKRLVSFAALDDVLTSNQNKIEKFRVNENKICETKDSILALFNEINSKIEALNYSEKEALKELVKHSIPYNAKNISR